MLSKTWNENIGIILNLEGEYPNTKKEIQNIVEGLGLPRNVFIAQLVLFLVLFALELVIMSWIPWEETVVNLELFEIGVTSSSFMLTSSKVNKFASSKESVSSRSNSSENTFMVYMFKTVKMKMQVQKTLSSHVLLSSFLLHSNRTTLQTLVYLVFNDANWPITRHSHWLCSEIFFTFCNCSRLYMNLLRSQARMLCLLSDFWLNLNLPLKQKRKFVLTRT